MLALWMIGRSLEPLLGRWRFVALYLIGGLGGSVAMAVLDPGVATVGASGGIFALMGALLVIGRHIGANIRGILVILAINLAIGLGIALIGFLMTTRWR
jgi:membrane associated rhomboid family serine protease